MFPGIFQPPRTIAHCIDRGLSLRVTCLACGRVQHLQAREICRAFAEWTADEIQRAGVLGCADCCRPAAVAVVGEFWARPGDLETWPPDGPAWVRKREDGWNG